MPTCSPVANSRKLWPPTPPVREIIARGDSGVEIFNPALMRLYSIITSSAIYIDYRKKKRPSLDDEVRFWTVVLNTVIAPSQLMAECARTDCNFSLAGFQKGVAMASRRSGSMPTPSVRMPTRNPPLQLRSIRPTNFTMRC